MGDYNHLVTLWGNVVISLAAISGFAYFAVRARRHKGFRTPLIAVAMVCAGIALRITPWAYAQLNSVDCLPDDARVVCLYDLLIIEARPWFTALAAMLILWGSFKFARWVDGRSLKWKLTCMGSVVVLAWALIFLW
jgi:hypothetical protein